MSPKFAAAIILVLIGAGPAAAAGVDSGGAARAGEGRLIRFAYANDVFTGSDRYYTQGIGLDYFDPILSRLPLMSLLPGLPEGKNAYGLTLRHTGFTPTTLGSDAPLIGNRPFAGYFYLGHVKVSRISSLRLVLTTELDAGIIGSGAGGKWMQTGIHDTLGNITPKGWDNQIRNDLVLDYSVLVEKGLASWRSAELAFFTGASLGTLRTNLLAGAEIRLSHTAKDPGRRHLIFARGEGKLVGYDATLQGGLFNRGSPYTLTASQIKRGVLRADIGLVFDGGGYVVEATRSFLSPEFSGGFSHQFFELAFIKRF